MSGAECESNGPHDFSRVFQHRDSDPITCGWEGGEGAYRGKQGREKRISVLSLWSGSRMYWDRFKVPRISHVHKYAVQIMNIKYLVEPGIR